MSVGEPTRRLAAILAVDIVNYARLVQTDGAGTLASWRALQARLTAETVAPHRGRVCVSTQRGQELALGHWTHYMFVSFPQSFCQRPQPILRALNHSSEFASERDA
jgi:class 3 adenylate cyclase